MKDEITMVAPIRAKSKGVISACACDPGAVFPTLAWPCASGHKALRSCGPCERAVDHVDRVLDAVDRDERAETRSLLLAEQHLVEHVEPVERDARLAVLGLDLAGLVEERLAPAHLVNHPLALLRAAVPTYLPPAT